MIVKVKCWNNDLKMWDECAYPLFKGMNPCEIIGFQDNEGSDLYSGLNDLKQKSCMRMIFVRVQYTKMNYSLLNTVKHLDNGFYISYKMEQL